VKNIQLSDFFENLAHKPYCADELLYGLQIRPKKTAINMQYIQGNQPCMLHYFFFDIDRSDAVMAWHDENLPMPYWTAQTQKNGHAHICYKLEIPLCTSEFGSQKAIAYASKIQAGLANKLGADVGYSHLITKNPFHKDWRVTFWSEQAYTLDYLADFVELPKKLSKKQEVSGLGRNCTLFENARKWAYKAVRDYFHHHSSLTWERAVLAYIEALNREFEAPLPYSEVKATAKSIANYCWKKFSHAGFSEWQSNNVKRANVKGACSKGGKARSQQFSDLRQQALQLHIDGMNNTKIAEHLKVSRKTITRWINRIIVQ
jgi:hypothetical protein